MGSVFSRPLRRSGFLFNCNDSNGNLIKQSNGLEFLYDHTGVFAVKHNNATYFYRKDAQANIVALLDSNGSVVVKYGYDAWGNCKVLNASGLEITDDTHIGILNPFRYRSYYFDTETSLYFLKTRYYDPEIGRFMTIDDLSFLDPESINGLNLYAYCLNNPIKYSDPNGTSITLGVILGIVALAGLITTCIGVGTDNNLVTAIGLTMVAVLALISGGMALACFGAWGTMAIGGITALAGIGTGLFASAEYQEAFTGNNWILATTGMSEGLYNGLMIAIASVATAGTFASMAGVAKYQNFGNSYWAGGWKKMRSHYWKHGLREMKFKNVYDYTHSARNIITNGKYVAQKNAYAMFIGGKKAAFVGVGHGNTLITTYSYRTLTLKKLIEFGLII